MVDKPQWPLNSEVLRNYTLYMENELGHNYLNTSFTGTTSAEEPQVQEDNTEQDECCGSGCGCHD
jgi:hypothetical protein|tara:strand:+ start:432 stop:626 length:195 start_codon:yes stop_codon:yes gene_type:complete